MENSFSGHSWHTASRNPHLASLNRVTGIRKQNLFVFFAAIKLAIHSSLAVARAIHQRNASYGKFLLRTLPAHCFKETTSHFLESHSLQQETKPFRFFGLLNSWFIVLSPVARALHQRNVPYGKFLLQTLLAHCLKESAPRFPNHAAFVRKQNSFVCFAVAEFVYVLSEPYRPKRLSVAIFCRGAVLVLAPPAPKLGEPADGVPYA